MRDYIIINGKNSNTVEGLMIQSLPPITKPAMRTQITEVDGRDGDLVTNLGYSAYDRTVEIGLFGNFNIDEVTRYFNQRGTVVFSNEPEKRYDFTLVDEINYEKLLRYRTASVVFHVQPFKHEASTPVNVTKNTTTRMFEDAQIASDVGITKITNCAAVSGYFFQDHPFVRDGEIIPKYPECVSNYEIDPATGEWTQIEKKLTFSAEGKTVEVPFAMGGRLQDMTFLGIAYGYMGTPGNYVALENNVLKLHRKIKMKQYGDTLVASYSTHGNVAYIPLEKPSDFIGIDSGDGFIMCSHGDPSETLTNTDADLARLIIDPGYPTFLLGIPIPDSVDEVNELLKKVVVYYETTNETVENLQDADPTLYGSIQKLNGLTLPGGGLEFLTDYDEYARFTIVAYVTEGSKIINAGNVNARPKLTIEGSGALDIYNNDGLKLHVASGYSSPLTIDTERMEAYDDTGYQDWKVSGSYEDFTLAPGTDGIIIDGNVEKLTVENYSRWI